MTDPISNERLGVIIGALQKTVDEANQIELWKLNALLSLRELQSRRQSPAGAEPVADLIREALRELDNVTALNDQDANCLGCVENLLRQALASSQPKAVIITDEMVDRAGSILASAWPGGFEDQSGETLNFTPNDRARDVVRRIAVALFSEAHNGRGGE